MNQSQQTYIERLGAAQVEWRLLVGDSYSTGQYFTDVADTNTKELFLDNSGNGSYAVITGIAIRAEGKITVDKAFNATEDTEGDPPATGVTNKRSDTDGSNITPRIGGSNETGAYSGGDSFSTKVFGSNGAAVRASPGQTVETLSNVIAPGDNMLIGATNQSGGLIDMSIDVDFVEIPGDRYP